MTKAPSPDRSTTALILRGLIGVAAFMVLLFIPAGRLNWLEGWAFFVFTLACITGITVWGVRNDPGLMRERSRAAAGAEDWDKTILRIYSVLLVAMLVVASLDGGRWGWSSVPLPLRSTGWVVLALAMLLGWWALSANTFASQTVRIQVDRGHKVVTAGPYRYVRHPMYVGVIFAVIAIPLVLGSWWALAPAGLIVVLFVIRADLEDRTLRRGLPGYNDYADRVPYRLLPGLW